MRAILSSVLRSLIVAMRIFHRVTYSSGVVPTEVLNHSAKADLDCPVAVLNSGDVGRRGIARWATDPESAERLWKLSASRTGMDLER
jgi:hypothetical protein